MSTIKRFEDILAWQEKKKFDQMIFQAISKKSNSVDFRFRSQIQAASVSVMTNIAEGFVRRSNKGFIQFLFIAISSNAEVQSYLYIALDRKYFDRKIFEKIYNQTIKVSAMISGLIKYLLEKQPSKGLKR